MSSSTEPPNGDLETWLEWAGTKLTVSLAVTLYFKPPPSSYVEGILEVYRRYLELCEPQLTWFADETTGKYRKASPEVLRIPFKRVPDAVGNSRFYSWGAFAGKHHRDAAPFQLHAVLSPDEYKDGTLSMVRAAFPVTQYAGDVGEFAALVRSWSSLVPVFHGYAGLSFSQSMESEERQINEPFLVSAAMRFSGIDVEDQSGTRLSCRQSIKGVNWLTLIADSFVQQLGGEGALREQLSDAIEVHRMPWGLMIQAGPEPGTGNVNEGDRLPLYREVNRALRPVRVVTHMNLGVEFDETRTRRWMHRLD